MICIVGLVRDGTIHMAGDKLGSNGYTKLITERPKIFKNGDFLFGYTTSFRMGQLIEFAWKQPEKLNSQSEDYYIYKVIVDSIKTLLKGDGFATDKEGGEFIFGYNGRLFKMQNDFSIFEYTSYAACGCGEDEALAVLFALDKLQYEPKDTTLDDLEMCENEYALKLAIEAASVNKTGVSSQYDYMTLGEES